MCFFPDEKFRKTCAELQCIRTICTLRPFLAVNVPHKKISNIWPVVALAFLGTYSNLEYIIIVHIKRSHSIYMLNIQIDTKSIEIRLDNIKLSFLANHNKQSFPLCTFIIDTVLLLDTLRGKLHKRTRCNLGNLKGIPALNFAKSFAFLKS